MATPIIDLYTKEELEQIVKESKSLAEVIDKLGYKTHSGCNNVAVKDRINKYNISTEHFTRTPNPTKRNEENIFIEDSTASQITLRKWYIKGNYTEYRCSICDMEPIWNGKDLTLILDHIDGNNKNDVIDNLRWVCPNCNQQLETTGFKKFASNKLKETKDIIKESKKNYCQECGKEITIQATLCVDCAGKKRRVVENRPDAETLEKLLLEANGNFSEVGRQYNVTDNTIRKWCLKYNMSSKPIDYQTKEIKPSSLYSKISVAQIDLQTNEIIAIYESIAEAKRKTGIKTIPKVISGEYKQAGGYRWEKINKDT